MHDLLLNILAHILALIHPAHLPPAPHGPLPTLVHVGHIPKK